MAIEKQRTCVWLCPKCNHRERQPTGVQAVSHSCPMAKVGNKIVELRLVG